MSEEPALSSSEAPGRSERALELEASPRPASPNGPCAGNKTEPCGLCGPNCVDCMDTIIHKLSQPLTCLRGPLELALLGDASPEAYRRAIEEAVAQADRLFQLLGSFRELTEYAVQAEMSGPVVLRDLVLDALDATQLLVDSQRLRVTVESAGDIEVRTDSKRLRGLLVRLLGNAIARAPEGGTLGVGISKLDGHACVAILDPGRAPRPAEVAALEAPHLHGLRFLGFPKGCNTEWLVAKQAVQALGGTLQVSDAAGTGHCLQLLLPLSGERQAS